MNPTKTTSNKVHAALAIDQFWAIEPRYASAMMEAMVVVPADAIFGQKKPVTSEYEKDGADAIILVDGPMMKGSTSFGDNCDTVAVRRRIRAAANDDSVARIILVMDSPGGSVFGTADLADDVRAAASVKPVIAYIEDMCCSACYWVASQCTEIVASPNALAIGSIGVYTIFWDESEMFEATGVKPILISSGGEKGKPCPGLPIEDETVATAQDFITHIYEQFTTTVSAGRPIEHSRVLSIADGRIFPAQEALGLGLVDRLASWDELFETTGSSSVAASASEATKEDMGLLDRFKSKAPEAPPAAVETTATPQAEVTEAHDMAAIEAAMKNSVVAIVKSKVDRYIDAGLLTTATSKLAADAINAAIEADGLSFEANGALVEGPMQQAVKALIEGLPKADLSTPKLPTAGGDDKRSVVVEDDKFASQAESYRKRAESTTPGMKKVKK